MAVSGVDWEQIDKRIPTAQLPVARAERDRLFTLMDASNNGFITISEAQNGLAHLLEKRGPRKRGEQAGFLVPVRDFKPAIKAAFALARKVAPTLGKDKKAKEAHDTCVDRREFHALLIAFRYYLELNVLFDAIDQDDTRGKLSWKEVAKALPLLETWQITEKQAKSKFKDEWENTMAFTEFAEWCISKRFGKLEIQLDEINADKTLKDAAGSGEVVGMVKAFQEWDIDGDGTISVDELADVLMALDTNFTREQAIELLEAADLNGDGNIDYIEFTRWITQ